MTYPGGTSQAPPELLGVRTVELTMLLSDLEATEEDAGAGKLANLIERWDSTAEWVDEAGLSEISGPLTDRLGSLKALDVQDLQASLRAATVQIAALTRSEMLPLMVLEAWCGANLQKGGRWSVDRSAAFAAAGSSLDEAFTVTPATMMHRRYERAVKRLSSDAVSPALRVGLLGGTAVVTIASGGIATALGTAIGGAMGLSGAAATSAGLAFLGGGSLAAGGFGGSSQMRV